jgi:hypothetical protein
LDTHNVPRAKSVRRLRWVFARLNALEDGAGSGVVPPILVDVATEDEIIDLAFRNA